LLREKVTDSTDDAQAKFELGSTCTEVGDFASAVTHLARARELGFEVEASYRLGKALDECGRHEEAVPYLLESLRPQTPVVGFLPEDVWDAIATLRRNQGRLEEAEDACRRSLGCRPDQARSAERLRERLAPHTSQLCKECQARFEKNVFRVLDCKNPQCHAIAWQVKESPFLLCEACQAHFEAVRRGLRDAGVAFDDTKVFARGLDYYTQTVFEVRAKGLGAQDAVAAGGRYNHLVEELGGPALGAVGFAAGIERVLMAIDAARPAAEAPHRRGLYLAIAQPTLLGEGFRFVQQLRERGVTALMDYDGKSLKAQLREADKAGCRLVAILGETEKTQRSMTLKDLEQGSQRAVTFDAFVDEAARQVKPSCQ